MSEAVERFAAAAGRFRELMERSEVEEVELWLREVAPVLTELKEGVERLPCEGLGADESADEVRILEAAALSDQEWARLFHRWADRFIVLLDLPASVGMEGGELLADDLVDLYRDLVPGLRLYETDPERFCQAAAAEWINLYRIHWGAHLTQAQEAIGMVG